MIKRIENPQGLDILIDEAQTILSKDLIKVLPNLTLYPRCKVMNTDRLGLMPMFFDGNEPINVLNVEEDTLFFHLSSVENKISNLIYESDIDIYLIIDLEKAYQDNSSYANDSFIKSLLFDSISKTRLYDIQEIETRNDIVLSNFISGRFDSVKELITFYPFQAFKVSSTVQYRLNEICK